MILPTAMWEGSPSRQCYGCARNRRPITSNTSQPSRNGMAQSKAKSLRMKDSHSTDPRIDMFSSTWVTARIR